MNVTFDREKCCIMCTQEKPLTNKVMHVNRRGLPGPHGFGRVCQECDDNTKKLFERVRKEKADG